MDLHRYDTPLRIATVVTVVVGLLLIGFTGPTLTSVGIVLVIASAVVFLVVVRNFIQQRAGS